MSQTHKILNLACTEPQLSSALSLELGISEITAQLLINRGIRNPAAAEKFLNPRLNDLHDPFSFSDMRLAVNFIRRAKRLKEKVLIYSDYDVDGVTSLALLKPLLAKMGLDVTHYIPHRIKEGYGLNKNIVRVAKEKGIRLVITADCGTGSGEIIQELRSHGIEVIVTDHHEPGEANSEQVASAVINPKVGSANYKYRDLAGVGVVYKLGQALSGELLESELDLVALGTIADSVPLTGENRILARFGLEEISRTKKAGLRVLIESSRIQNKKISPEFVSFILGPRINASGRLDTAETALSLLLTEDEEEAKNLAKTVEGHNRQRQKIESVILEEAQDLINQEVNFKEHQVMVVAKEGWHLGVLGIVASKLADRFYRPAILISLNSGLGRGSGRSIKNFHLFNAMMECGELLANFGGHRHAVGMVIPQSNIAEFKNRINSFARKTLNFQDLLPSIDIDMELGFADLNEELIGQIQSLEPFGKANPEPLFYIRNLKLKGEPRTFSKDTLKFWVTDGDLTYPAIGFGLAGLKDGIVNAASLDLVFAPKIDTWQGNDSLILEVKEIFFKLS